MPALSRNTSLPSSAVRRCPRPMRSLHRHVLCVCKKARRPSREKPAQPTHVCRLPRALTHVHHAVEGSHSKTLIPQLPPSVSIIVAERDRPQHSLTPASVIRTFVTEGRPPRRPPPVGGSPTPDQSLWRSNAIRESTAPSEVVSYVQQMKDYVNDTRLEYVNDAGQAAYEAIKYYAGF